MGQKTYSIQTKRAACTAYLVTGSYTDAAKELGLSKNTVCAWAKTDWWAAWEEDITEELGKHLVAKMRGLALEAYRQQLERLQNGDIHVSSSGEITRHPVKFKDLSMASNVTSDKIRLAEGKATMRTEKTGSLADLAAEFEKIAARYGNTIRDMGELRPIIDGEAIRTATAALPGDKR